MNQAVILAGGKGTRLKERLGDLPKPMIPLAGRPLIEHQLELCARHGITDVLILTGYQGQVIAERLGDGSRWGVHARCITETDPLGTAGAVLAILNELATRFLVLYGDTLVNVDLRRMAVIHQQHDADATLLLHPNDHPLDSDLVEVDSAGWVCAFHNRPHPPNPCLQNLVNAALYVIEKHTLASQDPAVRFLDFGKDLFPAMLSSGQRLWGHRSTEYIKDIGTPQRYDRVCAELQGGIVARAAFGTPQPAVFLDRDGTLNREIDGVIHPDQLELLPGTAQAVARLNHAGFRAVVVTNQPVVAKGLCTEADLARIHGRLEMELGRQHAFLDRIYTCPHHPEKGWPGERPDLKIPCACRKPGTGLIDQAVAELGIDRTASWLVGDTTTDIETAQRAGLRSILVQTGHAGGDGRHAVKADAECPDLAGAVDHILAHRTSIVPS